LLNGSGPQRLAEAVEVVVAVVRVGRPEAHPPEAHRRQPAEARHPRRPSVI
jgi:hypothetical protein